MTKAKAIRLTDPSAESSGTREMPAFKVVPLVGKTPLDAIEADLTLITVVQGMRVPTSLHAMDADVGTKIKDTIKGHKFGGRRGQSLLFDVPLADGQTKRKVLIAGIGRADEYCGEVACEVFRGMFDKALQEGLETVVVPVVPKRATSDCMSIKSTVIKLRKTLAHAIAAHAGEVKLKEVQIYCTTQAARHVREGIAFALPTKHTQGCNCNCGGDE